MKSETQAVLLVSSPDRRGIVAKLASFMQIHGINIVQVDQSVDAEHGDFRMRMVVEGSEAQLPGGLLREKLEPIAREEGLSVSVHAPGSRASVMSLTPITSP